MTYLAFLISFYLLFTAITYRNFKHGLSLFVLLLPTYWLRFSIGFLPSTAIEGVFVILAAVWLIKFIQQKRSFKDFGSWMKQQPFFAPGLLLIVAATISIFTASNTLDALGLWKAYFIEPFLLYFIFRDTVKTKKDWEMILSAMGATVIGLTVIAVAQYLTGRWLPTWEWSLPESRRATAVFTSPNALGLYVAPVLMMYVGRLMVSVNAPAGRSYQYVVIASSALAIWLSHSRGAMVGIAVAMVYLGWVLWSRRKTLLITVAAISLLLIVPASRASIIEAATLQTPSIQSRLNLYRGTYDLLKEHPIAGTGLASFATRFEEVRPEGYTEKLIYPHNIFLNFWTQTGILGLIALLWIIVRVAKKGMPQRGVLTGDVILVAVLITMLVHGLVDVPYFKNDLAFLSWVVLAGVSITPRPPCQGAKIIDP